MKGEFVGWEDMEGRHEVYVAMMFADGSSGSGWAKGGITVTVDAKGNDIPVSRWPTRGYDEVTGWEVRCNHRDNPEARDSRRVVLARWERVATPQEEDRSAGRIYAAGSDVFHLDGREDVEEIMNRLWDAHCAPDNAFRAIELAAAERRQADARLDAAVATGQEAGLSWADVGRAVGITRQSARERWGSIGTAVAELSRSVEAARVSVDAVQAKLEAQRARRAQAQADEEGVRSRMAAWDRHQAEQQARAGAATHSEDADGPTRVSGEPHHGTENTREGTT